jgi:hypothetical protein
MSVYVYGAVCTSEELKLEVTNDIMQDKKNRMG